MSSEWISDELFQVRKGEFIQAGIDEAFAGEILHKRKALYDKFYPQATQDTLLERVKVR